MNISLLNTWNTVQNFTAQNLTNITCQDGRQYVLYDTVTQWCQGQHFNFQFQFAPFLIGGVLLMLISYDLRVIIKKFPEKLKPEWIPKMEYASYYMHLLGLISLAVFLVWLKWFSGMI